MTDVKLGINLWSQAGDWPSFLAAGRRAEEQRADEAEHRHVGADADGHREHGDRREHRRMGQDPQGVSDVLEQTAHDNRSQRAACHESMKIPPVFAAVPAAGDRFRHMLAESGQSIQVPVPLL